MSSPGCVKRRLRGNGSRRTRCFMTGSIRSCLAIKHFSLPKICVRFFHLFLSVALTGTSWRRSKLTAKGFRAAWSGEWWPKNFGFVGWGSSVSAAISAIYLPVNLLPCRKWKYDESIPEFFVQTSDVVRVKKSELDRCVKASQGEEAWIYCFSKSHPFCVLYPLHGFSTRVKRCLRMWSTLR